MNAPEYPTVRDIFAAEAMSAIIAKLPLGTAVTDGPLARSGTPFFDDAEVALIRCGTARSAYAYADAMLAARAPAAPKAPPPAPKPPAETLIPPDCQCFPCVFRRAVEVVLAERPAA